MKLSDFLGNKAIATNLRARDKNGALREIVDILHKSGRIKNTDAVLNVLLGHETSDAPDIGQGVVFSHVSIDRRKGTVALFVIYLAATKVV